MSIETQHKSGRPAQSLRDLYRRLDAAAVPAWLDGETLAAAVAGTLPPELKARVDVACAQRPALQALVDSLRALEPQAQTLAAALAAAPQVARAHAARGRQHARHGVHVAGQRASRRTPWLAVAASLLLAVAAGGMWTAQQHVPAEAAQAATTPAEDDIFSASMDGAHYASSGASSEDGIFRSDFKRS